MLIFGMLVAVVRAATASAQPADCLTAPSSGPMLPLSLDLAGRYGVPSGVTGQAYVAVPMETPGIACAIPPPHRMYCEVHHPMCCAVRAATC